MGPKTTRPPAANRRTSTPLEDPCTQSRPPALAAQALAGRRILVDDPDEGRDAMAALRDRLAPQGPGVVDGLEAWLRQAADFGRALGDLRRAGAREFELAVVHSFFEALEEPDPPSLEAGQRWLQ